MGNCKISALCKFTSVRILTPIRFGRLSEVRCVGVVGKGDDNGMYRFSGILIDFVYNLALLTG